MKKHYPSVGIDRLCRLFGKTRQAYYDHNWRDDNETFREVLIIERVKDIRSSIAGIGGVQLLRILKEEFSQYGIAIGRDRFYELLREHSLIIKRRKKHIYTTNSDHPYRKWPNLISQWKPAAIEQLWVADITYLQTEGGFVFLSLITDAYSRKIVGYHLSQHLKVKGCLVALNKAIGSLTKTGQSGLIHHSDRGVQYCCEAYVSALLANHISISMTQSGSPYENAIAERVNGILKTQLGLNKVFQNYNAAVAQVSKSIDAYNRLKPHMSVSNLTPNQAHTTTRPLIRTWKTRKPPLNSKGNINSPLTQVTDTSP